YTSPGWLQLQSETADGQTAPVFKVAYENNADATVSQREIDFAFSGPVDTTQAAYKYDGQRRLTSAVVAGGKPGSETIGSYDANGNIWKTTQDGANYDFTLESGSDRLQTAVLAGTNFSFAYSANGWLKKTNNLAIEHDDCLGLTTNVTVTGTAPCQVR